MTVEPRYQLLLAVRVLQPGQADGLVRQLLGADAVYVQRPLNQPCIHPDTISIHENIHLPQAFLFLWHREQVQPLQYLMFCDYVLFAVFLEQGPFVCIMPWLVPCPSPIGPGWLAGYTEIPYQSLADRKLLLVLRQPDGPSRGIQAGGVSAVQAVGHGAAPLLDRCLITGAVQAVPFERRVISVLNYIGVPQGIFPYLRWE